MPMNKSCVADVRVVAQVCYSVNHSATIAKAVGVFYSGFHRLKLGAGALYAATTASRKMRCGIKAELFMRRLGFHCASPVVVLQTDIIKGCGLRKGAHGEIRKR